MASATACRRQPNGFARPADDAFAVTIRERLDDGTAITITRRYNGCAKTKPTIRTHHRERAGRRRSAGSAAGS
jgi:hypothetical protein